MIKIADRIIFVFDHVLGLGLTQADRSGDSSRASTGEPKSSKADLDAIGCKFGRETKHV